MKRLLLPLLVVAFLAGCAGRPIENFDQRPVPIALQNQPLDRIEELILEAGHVRKWQFDKAGPGHLIATQMDDTLSAVVDIYFDQKKYSINYKSSTGFNETGGRISPHYNLWLRNLNKDIEVRMVAAADRAVSRPRV